MKKFILLIMVLLCSNVYAVNNISFDDLLQQAKHGRAEDRQTNAERMRTFKKNKAEQKALLAHVKKELIKEEQRSKNLEQSFETNDLKLIKLHAELKQKQGRLKELLGSVQQLTGDTLGQLEESIISAQFPERINTLQQLNSAMSDGTSSISMSDIRQVWYEVLREIIESGNIAVFKAPVTDPAGIRTEQSITRFGTFNIAKTGDTPAYLNYSADNGGSLSELARQPNGSYVSSLESFDSQAVGNAQAIGIDPTRGQLLKALMQEPDLIERFHQGGLVGYLIAALGAVAFIISLFKISVISKIKHRFNQQLNDLKNIKLDNALGRVISVQQQSTNLDLESLELKFSEAIHRETPVLTKYHSVLKIIAVIAPLMGLLGTVVGMIITFQAITLYGTGDPKLMAGGISSALVTTVLGLIVAIPTLFAHNYLSDQSKSLIQILEEQAIGHLAQQTVKK